MKIVPSHALPIVLALCIWLGGNLIVTTTSAKAQEVAAGANVLCVDNPDVRALTSSRCGARPINGRCGGHYDIVTFTKKECNGPHDPNVGHCTPSTKDGVIGEEHHGYCRIARRGAFKGSCEIGPDAPKSMFPRQYTVNNVPWCSNDPFYAKSLLQPPPLRVAMR